MIDEDNFGNILIVDVLNFYMISWEIGEFVFLDGCIDFLDDIEKIRNEVICIWIVIILLGVYIYDKKCC